MVSWCTVKKIWHQITYNWKITLSRRYIPIFVGSVKKTLDDLIFIFNSASLCWPLDNYFDVHTHTPTQVENGPAFYLAIFIEVLLVPSVPYKIYIHIHTRLYHPTKSNDFSMGHSYCTIGMLILWLTGRILLHHAYQLAAVQSSLLI